MFATGVTIVTARTPAGVLVGLTANSFNSVSLNPPLVLWSLAQAAGSMAALSAGSHYAINILAADNAESLKKLTDAVNAADNATKTANEATEASKKLLGEIEAKKADLDKQLREAQAQYQSLSASVRNQLANSGDMSKISVPAGTAGRALQFALDQRGKAYVYGSNGPDTWDCSSLIQAAYRSAGVAIGRTSYAQATAGRQVSRSEVKAGDIIVYYSSQSHVAMAVDGIRAVHASTEGVPVKIADIDSIGPVTAIRRIEG
jgi:cell wall-associated NlpC family hydrolase